MIALIASTPDKKKYSILTDKSPKEQPFTI